MAKPHAMTDEDRENLVAYLDGELDAQAAHALEAKLGLDPKSRREAETLKKTWDLLDYLPKPQPSPTFTTRTMDRLAVQKALKPRSAAWTWRHRVLWIASVLAAFAISYAFGRAAALRQRDRLDREHLGRELPMIENYRLYRNILDLDFLDQLGNDPELFGDEGRDS